MRDNDNSQESKSGGVGIFILFILILFLIAGAAGALYGSRIQEKPKDLSDTSVKSFDLMEESKMAHKTVDDVLLLKRENWQLRYPNADSITTSWNLPGPMFSGRTGKLPLAFPLLQNWKAPPAGCRNVCRLRMWFLLAGKNPSGTAWMPGV